MQEPETIDPAVASWIRHFVEFQEEAVFEYAPPDAWPTTVTALTNLAAELTRREHDNWFVDPGEPWWERTNDATAHPIEGLDPSVTADLASALVSAMRTLTQAAELLLSSLVPPESTAPDDDEDDDGAPF